MVLLDSNSLHPLKFCHKLVLDSYHHVAVFASNQQCENKGCRHFDGVSKEFVHMLVRLKVSW